MSPSDHFMAANVVFVVTFQFLLYFLAHVVEYLTLYVILGVSLCCGNRYFCFVLWVLISFPLCNTKKLHNDYVAHYCGDVYKNYYVNPQTAILKYCST